MVPATLWRIMCFNISNVLENIKIEFSPVRFTDGFFEMFPREEKIGWILS